MHEKGGGMASGSIKQKLNKRLLTEAELVASDDFLAKIVWVKLFLYEQGIDLKKNILFQDNKSANLLEKKGRAAAGKRSRAINI